MKPQIHFVERHNLMNTTIGPSVFAYCVEKDPYRICACQDPANPERFMRVQGARALVYFLNNSEENRPNLKTLDLEEFTALHIYICVELWQVGYFLT